MAGSKAAKKKKPAAGKTAKGGRAAKKKNGGPDYSKWTEVERVILERRSVRLYKKKQVPEFLVRRILEAGRFAPSAGNSQPWKFSVVQDPNMIREMTDQVVKICKMAAALDFRKHAYLAPLVKAMIHLQPNNMHPIPMGAIASIAEGKLGLFHGAPTVILVMKDKRGVSNPDLDCGIAGQNMVLAAHSLGLGTCWVGFVSVLDAMPSWRKRLGIEYPYKLLEGIAVGYPMGEPDGPVPREKLKVDWYDEDGSFRVVE